MEVEVSWCCLFQRNRTETTSTSSCLLAWLTDFPAELELEASFLLSISWSIINEALSYRRKKTQSVWEVLQILVLTQLHNLKIEWWCLYNVVNVINATQIVHWKMVKMANFMLYILYYNFKKGKKIEK